MLSYLLFSPISTSQLDTRHGCQIWPTNTKCTHRPAHLKTYSFSQNFSSGPLHDTRHCNRVSNFPGDRSKVTDILTSTSHPGSVYCRLLTKVKVIPGLFIPRQYVWVGSKVSQIGTKWDKSRTFKDHFQYILARRVKMYKNCPQKSHICSIWGQTDTIRRKPWQPVPKQDGILLVWYRCETGMSGLTRNRGRLAPNGIYLELSKISFTKQNFLKTDHKKPRICPTCNSTHKQTLHLSIPVVKLVMLALIRPGIWD